MKKVLLFALLPLLFATGCQKEPGAPLPGPSEGSYTVKLTADNSTLTTEDSTSAIQRIVTVKINQDKSFLFQITSIEDFAKNHCPIATQIPASQTARHAQI